MAPDFPPRTTGWVAVSFIPMEFMNIGFYREKAVRSVFQEFFVLFCFNASPGVN